MKTISVQYPGYELRIKVTQRLIAVLLLAGAISLCACEHKSVVDNGSAGFAVSNSADTLPADLSLVDQNGHKVVLSSLKGEPTLVDFIYTSCPGECLMLTQRMKIIATRLGPALGTKARLVSITVDPEHDGPEQLLNYANRHGANMNGWLFLSGTPKQIDDAMARFDLIRKHEADGTVDHVLEMFLVAPDGRVLLQYMGDKIDPTWAVADLGAAAAGKAVTAGDGTIVRVSYYDSLSMVHEPTKGVALMFATVSVALGLTFGLCILSYRSDSRAETWAPGDGGSAQIVGPIIARPKSLCRCSRRGLSNCTEVSWPALEASLLLRMRSSARPSQSPGLLW